MVSQEPPCLRPARDERHGRFAKVGMMRSIVYGRMRGASSLELLYQFVVNSLYEYIVIYLCIRILQIKKVCL
jgi:hypothetical protein